MTRSTKSYKTYGAMQADLSDEEIGKQFLSDLRHVFTSYPEIYRMLVFLRDNLEDVKEKQIMTDARLELLENIQSAITSGPYYKSGQENKNDS